MFPPLETAPDLEDYQWHFNGLTFGAGTPIAVLNVDGIDLAEVRSGDVSWPRDHGQAMGLDVLGGRPIIFDLWCKSNGTSLESTLNELAAATQVKPNEEMPLWFQLPNEPPLCIMCRPRKRPKKIDANYAAANIAEPELTFAATDPRIYGETQGTVIAWGTPGTVMVDNTGNMEMRPVVVFTGPLAACRIANAAISGVPYLEFKNPQYELEQEAALEKALAEELKTIRETWEVSYNKLRREARELYAEARYAEAEEKEKEAREVKEAGNKEETEAQEASAKAKEEAKEKREEEEEKGELVTVGEGDQLLVDLGTPHLVEYYTGHSGKVFDGMGGNVMEWLQPESVWWDIPPGVSNIEFSSKDSSDPGGSAEIQWGPASEL